MRHLIWFTVAAGFTSTLAAQPANPQDLDKARELLRKTKPVVTNAAASTNQMTGQASVPGDTDQRAREMLRRAVAGSRLSQPSGLQTPPATASTPVTPAVAQPIRPQPIPGAIPPAGSQPKPQPAVNPQPVATTVAPPVTAVPAPTPRPVQPTAQPVTAAPTQPPPQTIPAPRATPPPTATPALSEEAERQRRLQLIQSQVDNARKARTATTPAPAATEPGHGATAQTAPQSRSTLSPDMEQRVRALLDQATQTVSPTPTPVLQPAPVPAQPAPRPAPPTATPPTEAARPQPKEAPIAAVPPSAPAPVPSRAPAPVQTQQTATVAAPAPTPAPVAETPSRYQVVPTQGPGTLNPDMERRARELLDQVLIGGGTRPTAQPAPGPGAEVAPRPAITQPLPVPSTQPPAAQTLPSRPALAAPAQPPPTAQPLPTPRPATVAPPAAAIPATPPPAAVIPQPRPQPAIASPIATPNATAAASPRSGGTLSPDQEARARELLDRTWSRLNPAAAAAASTTPATTTITPGVPAPAPGTTPQGRAQQQIDQLNADALRKATDAAQQRSRKDVIRDLQKDAEAVAATPARSPQRSSPTPPPASAPKVNNRTPPPSGTPAPATGPAVMSSKQQRLTQLLEAYKGDKISPAEYHAQRAKILAEP